MRRVQPFITHSGRAVSLRRSNVDADQIIPVRFMTRPTARGFGDALFHDWRQDGEFVLDNPNTAERAS